MNFFGVKHLKLSIYVTATGETYVIEGLPITASIEKTGGEGLQRANISVAGLGSDTLQKLSIIEFRKTSPRVNEILLEAKDDENADYGEVFKGNAISSLPVYETSGNTRLEIEAMSGYIASIATTKPVSVKEATNAKQLFQMFAKEAETTADVSNLGDYMIKNCIFSGSPQTKAKQLAKQIKCDFIINDNIFVARDFSQETDSGAPIVSVSTGLVGYPRFTHTGISFQTIFNPQLQLGGQIKMVSSVEQFNGNWVICKIVHKLDAFLPSGGNWYSDVETYQVGGVNKYGRGR